MRFALALLALTLPLFAQDPDGPEGQPDKPFDGPRAGRSQEETAASLFYRAFWIEQAQRESEAAEKLYVDLIERFADAPEAPRAYVALIRLRAARGEEVDPLVAKLEQRYPKAVAEIGTARRMAARLRVEFDPVVREDDTPMMRKVKAIYSDLHTSNGISSEDEDFLSDLGAAGHPMLARVLRSSESGTVKRATDVLLNQETDAAYAVIGDALRDPSILYRMTIIDQARTHAAYPAGLMKTLRDIWPQASRSLRQRIARTWAWAAGSQAAASEACYGYLVGALQDEDPEVRLVAATLPNALERVVRPRTYVEAVLPLCLEGDPAVQYVWQWLPWQLAHKDLVPKLLEALGGYDGVLTIRAQRQDEQPLAEDLALAMARMSIARYGTAGRTLPSHDGTTGFTALAAESSPRAAGMLLDAALRLGRAELAWPVRNALTRVERGANGLDDRIADADRLRARAIAGSYDESPQRRQAADAVLQIVGVRAGDLALVVREAKAHPDRGLLPAAMQQSFLRELGAQGAAELIPAAHSSQLASLLQSGQRVWLDDRMRATVPEPDRSSRGEPFWVAMLERFEPSGVAWHIIFQLPRQTGSLAQLVAAWALDSTDQEALNWTLPGKVMSGTKYAERLLRTSEVRAAAAAPPVRDRLFRAAADERLEVGLLALRVAYDVKGEAALVAHRTALDSPWDDVVEGGLKQLPEHGEAGAAVVAAVLQRPNLSADLRKVALEEFATSHAQKQMPFVRKRLDARCGGYEADVMWGVAFEYEPEATVERALREVTGEGPAEFRNGALDILTQCSDPRRIEVFRSILRDGKDADRVHAVLRTVAAQYLIELGPEVLLHLRNPDNGIRTTATQAIERLKFYAEAKKLFDKER